MKKSLVVTIHTGKNGGKMPCVKYGSRFVTFDQLVICSMLHCDPDSIMDLLHDRGDIVLAEF